MLQQQRRSRRVLLRRVAGLQGCVQDLEAVDVHRSCRLVGQAWRLEVRTKVQLRHSVWRHCEVHLGRAPGALVAHEAAVQWVVDVVGLGHVHHEVGGRAEPVAAGEEQLPPGRQVVGAHDVPRVRRQGQGVAVHAYSRGVRSRCWGKPSSLTVRRPWICSPMAATTSSARTAICRAQTASVTPSLPANKPSTCVMV